MRIPTGREPLRMSKTHELNRELSTRTWLGREPWNQGVNASRTYIFFAIAANLFIYELEGTSNI